MDRADELAKSIVNRYLSLHRDQRHFSHRLRKTFDISGRQLAVLRFLCEQSPRNVHEISHHLYIRDGTTSPLLERMERAGYVVRRRCERDNRRVLVEPTELGREMVIRAPMGIVARLRADLPTLDVEKLEAIDDALATLARLGQDETETGDSDSSKDSGAQGGPDGK